MDIDALFAERLDGLFRLHSEDRRARDKDINCHYCGLQGHRVSDCRKLKAEKKNNAVREGFDVQSNRYKAGFGPRGPTGSGDASPSSSR